MKKLLTKTFLTQTASISTNWGKVFKRGRMRPAEVYDIAKDGAVCLVGCFHEYSSDYFKDDPDVGCKECSEISTRIGQIFSPWTTGDRTRYGTSLKLEAVDGEIKQTIGLLVKRMYEHARQDHKPLWLMHRKESRKAKLL